MMSCMHKYIVRSKFANGPAKRGMGNAYTLKVAQYLLH